MEEILLKILVTAFFSCLLGYERAKTGSNAGMTTHMLLGIGVTIFAIVQDTLNAHDVAHVLADPNLKGILSVNTTRLIAQVISGIGFLGAGTIIITKRRISGLTTATSLWVNTSCSMAIGLGLYEIGIIGYVVTFSVLYLFKRILHVNSPERLIINYTDDQLADKLQAIFEEHAIQATLVSYKTSSLLGVPQYSVVYRLTPTKNFSIQAMITAVLKLPGITGVERANIE